MLELLHVSFFIEIEGWSESKVYERVDPKFREECKELFTSMGFHVKEERNEEFRNLRTSLGLQSDDELVQRGDECLRIRELSIDGNILPSSLPEIEEKLRSGKTFHYNALRSYGTVYILSVTEAADYYNKHLEAYEKQVIEYMKIYHDKLHKDWVMNPMPYYKGDIRICIGHDVIYFFYLKIEDVLKDMLSRGLIKSNGSLVVPGFVLPEFYHENKKYGGPNGRGR